jgi:hypothetical protein
MANPNAPFGLRAVRRFDGGVVGRTNGKYTIANAYANAIGYGDIVKTVDTYQSLQANGGSQPVAGPNINIATTGGHPIGVFEGCKYQDTLGNYIWSKNWVASTATLNGAGAQAIVCDDPNTVFQVQSDGTVANTDVGKFATFVNNGVPNALGISTLALHEAGVTTTITDFKILGLVQRPGYSVAGAFGIVEVLLALHELATPVSNG